MIKFLNVPMVTIFKNATNLLIVGGEWYFYDEDISIGVFLSIFLMVVGVVAAAANDISFTFEGMCWALVNCATTAGVCVCVMIAF
jgi:GDP-mannose transporter